MYDGITDVQENDQKEVRSTQSAEENSSTTVASVQSVTIKIKPAPGHKEATLPPKYSIGKPHEARSFTSLVFVYSQQFKREGLNLYTLEGLNLYMVLEVLNLYTFEGLNLYTLDGLNLYTFEGLNLYMVLEGLNLYNVQEVLNLYTVLEGLNLYTVLEGLNLYTDLDGLNLYTFEGSIYTWT